jgi:hypothetical protein
VSQSERRARIVTFFWPDGFYDCEKERKKRFYGSLLAFNVFKAQEIRIMMMMNIISIRGNTQ